MKKEKKYMINIIIFLSILSVLGLANLLQTDRPTVSQRENRTLAAMPDFSWESLIADEYTEKMDRYVADTFLFRDGLIDISKRVEALRGVSGRDKVVLVSYEGNYADTETHPVTQVATESAIDAAEAADSSRPSDETAGAGEPTASSGLIFLGNRIMESFSYSEAVWDGYAAMLNAIDDGFGGDIRVLTLIAPSSVSLYLPKAYESLSDNEATAISHLYGDLNRSIVPVKVYPTLKKHADEYLYFRSDHHWTALAAYYAYLCYLEQAFPKDQPVLPEKLESGQLTGFLGYLNYVSPRAEVSDDPDTVYYWNPPVNTTFTVYRQGYGTAGEVKPIIDADMADKHSPYEIFISGDSPFSCAETELDNGRVLLMTKDSYGNALVPWLVNHYEKIYVVDPRYFEGNLVEIARTLGVTDVLIFNNALSVGNAAWTRFLTGLFVFNQ